MKLVGSKVGVLSRVYCLVVRMLIVAVATNIDRCYAVLVAPLSDQISSGLSCSNTLPSSTEPFQRDLAIPQEHVVESRLIKTAPPSHVMLTSYPNTI